MSQHEEEQQTQSEDHGGRLAWFLTGAITGAALAILFAPRSGSETRDLLAQTAQDGVDRSREIYDRGRQLVDDAGELFERGRKLARGLDAF